MGKKISEAAEVQNPDGREWSPVAQYGNDDAHKVQLGKYRSPYKLVLNDSMIGGESDDKLIEGVYAHDPSVNQYVNIITPELVGSLVVDMREEHRVLYIGVGNDSNELTIIYNGGNVPVLEGYRDGYFYYINQEPEEYDDEKTYILSIQNAMLVFAEIDGAYSAQMLGLDEEEE